LRALHVFTTYPGEADEGSAVFGRGLTRELRRQGAEVEVLASRARRLDSRRAFHIVWPNELPERGQVDGIPVRRFRSIGIPSPAAALIDRAVLRHWHRRQAREERGGGERLDVEGLFAGAGGWPAHLDLAARAGRGPLSPGLLRAVRARAREVDVVLAGHAPFGLPGWVERAARGRAPVVLLPFLHEADPFHHLPSLHATYRQAAAVLTLSPHTAELLGRHLPGARAVAIGAAADLDTFDAGAVSGDRFRRRHGLEEERIVLFVGRKDAGKRYDLALRAAADLPQGCRLVMVGRDVDRRPLPPGVVHVERLPAAELADAYDASELLLHPSDQESFGIVCLEAWLRRKPVLANARCGASAALIEDGRDGVLLDPAADWGAAVRDLLADPERARRLGEAGRERVLREFTWERVGARALGVYEEVAGAAAERRAPIGASP
jgi:glycosyltransferase involved in cell wall biosynthesis